MTTDRSTWSRRSALRALGAVPLAGGLLGAAQQPAAARQTGSDLDARIQEIVNRPALPGARWGMKFCRLDTGRQIYAMNSAQLFTAASSYKVFPGGTAFENLGPGYRFRTRVHACGPIVRGVLDGDLVLVASGDLLLGGRVQPDGTLALPTPDHSYGAAPLPGDPIGTLRDLAHQVTRRGVRRIEGRVRVDTSLFRQGVADIAIGGAQIPISPIMVNDNVIDVVVRAGDRIGAVGEVHLPQQLGYVRIVNQTRTVAASDVPRRLQFNQDVEQPDGTRVVTLSGDVPIGGGELFAAYYIQGPAAFAAMAFEAALRDEGIDITKSKRSRAESPTNRALLAEHVSLPLAEQVKPLLKVSSNIHAAYFPYLTGAIAGRDSEYPKEKGKALESDLFARAGLEPHPPGGENNQYTADFFVPFLTYLSRRPYFPAFLGALPVMGRDGTLADVQVDSPAAGHVFAKTGSAMGGRIFHKALAGYIRHPNGSSAVFAEFVSGAATSNEDAARQVAIAGEALGEIATAVYEEALS